MQIDQEQLLEFCSYYTLCKVTSHLSIINHTAKEPQIEHPHEDKKAKPVRRKLQFEDKKKNEKIVRQKFEQVRPKDRKSKSPINHERIQNKKQKTKKEDDVDYYLNLFKTQNNSQFYDRSHERNNEKYKSTRLPPQYQTNTPNQIKNYQTFGKSTQIYQQMNYNINKPNFYTTWSSKTNQKPQPYISNFTPNDRQQPKDPWKVNQSKYANYFDPQRSREKSKSIHDTPVSYLHESSIGYSRIQRDVSPSNSNLTLRLSTDTLIKSRSRHQRKKSQRPLYDTSRLTPQPQIVSFMNKQQFVQRPKMTESYISAQPSKKDDHTRRQTNITIIQKLNRDQRESTGRVELDDGLQQELMELQERKVPVKVQVKMR